MGIWDFSSIKTEKDNVKNAIAIVKKETESLGAHYNNAIRAYFDVVNNTISKSVCSISDEKMLSEGKTEAEKNRKLENANRLSEEERYVFDIADDIYMFRVFELFISNAYPIRMRLNSDIFTQVYPTIRDICSCNKANNELTINNEFSFIECLGYVLNSTKVRRIVEGMLANYPSVKNNSTKKKSLEEKTISQVLSIDQLLEGKRIITLKFAKRIWNLESVDKFIELVKSGYINGGYYIGTLIFANSPENTNRLILVDGQSRIITMLLMLSVIDERLKTNNRSSRYANLIINDTDLKATICSSIEEDTEVLSHDQENNYRLIRKHVNEKLDGLIKALQISLEALNDYLLYDIDLVQIILSGTDYIIKSTGEFYTISN